MKRYTFNQLVTILENKGNNLAYIAIGRMMNMVEEDTGVFPDWNDIAPDWVINFCGVWGE